MTNRSDFNQNFKRVLLWGIVFIFFAFPISNSAANTLMAATLLLWMATGGWDERFKIIKSNPGVWLAAGLYMWMIIGIIYSPADLSDILDHLRKYLKLIFMVVVITMLSDGKWGRRSWLAFSLALTITLASTYLSIWFQFPWSQSDKLGWGNDHTVFKDYISQGILVSFFTAICLSQFIKEKSKLKYIYLLLAVLSIFSISHLSSGRSGYLALLATLTAFTFYSLKGWRRWLSFLLIIISVIGIYSTSNLMQERVERAINEAQKHNINDFSSIGQRLYFAQKTVQLIKEKPLLGWGTGAYHDQFCRIADSEKWCRHGKFHPHNQFLFIWMEHGLVGLSLFAGLILIPIWTTRHAPAHIRGLAAAYSGIFVVISMTHGSLWLSTESHFHTLMGALILAGYKPKPKKNSSVP